MQKQNRKHDDTEINTLLQSTYIYIQLCYRSIMEDVVLFCGVFFFVWREQGEGGGGALGEAWDSQKCQR